jgi:DNA-binding LytR/AlgR family response regulator
MTEMRLRASTDALHDRDEPFMTATNDRFFVQLSIDRWRAVDLGEIYLVEADGDDCRVRLRSKEPLVDLRRLANLEELLAPRGFVRIHRSFLVNPARILELRRRDGRRGWEVVMEPPVNLVLPVAEDKVDELREEISPAGPGP